MELQTLEVDGEHQDYLKLAYQGGEILYVPLNLFIEILESNKTKNTHTAIPIAL